jgi:DNA (cytosine-5)-methyltransferase 1
VRECQPRVFIWENVKGAFSSNSGEDFAAIIQEFADIGGYRLEWQLLNTSWFLPQNRERIYLVGYSTTPKRGWRGVFPIRESGEQTNLRGINVIATSENDVQSRRVYGSDGIARTLTSGDYKSPMRVEIKQIGTKFDSNGGTQPYQQDRVYDADGIVPALNQGKSDLIIKANYPSKALNETIENSNLIEGEPQALDLYNRVARDESPTLTEPHHNSLRMFDGYRVRRLTPIECERLQGFPDDHTSFGNYDGEVKPVSNTHRYKQCGNAVTVDVVSAVAKKCIPLFK